MGGECGKTMDDIMEERKWKIRHEGNWLDNGGEEFIKDYLDLPLSPQKEGPQLRARGIAWSPILVGVPPPPKPNQKGKKSNVIKNRAIWSDEVLKQANDVVDCGYTMRDVCETFDFPRTSLKDYYEGKVKGKKMGPRSILTIEEEVDLVEYMMEMMRAAHPLSVIDPKMTVVEYANKDSYLLKMKF